MTRLKSNFIPTVFYRIAPFLMLLGVAMQGIGLYCFIIIPSFFFLKSINIQAKDFSLIQSLIIAAAVSYLLFPAADFISLLDAKQNEMLFTNPVSSAVMGSALALWLMLIVRKNHLPLKPIKKTDNLIIFQEFTKGLAWASIFLLICVSYQYYNGIDFKNFPAILPHSEHLPNQRFRSAGFFGHPLSLAGVTLAILSFYCVLFYKNLLTAEKSFQKIQNYYVIIIICHLLCLIVSSSRFSLVCACIPLFFYPLYIFISQRKKYSLTKNNFIIILISLLSLSIFIYILLQSGALSRFSEIPAALSSGKIDRLKFWEVYWNMIIDKPIFGHGPSAMKNGLRENYYNISGYVDFHKKFNAHNIYLEILANIGIIGFMLLCAVNLRALSFLKSYCKLKKMSPLWSAFAWMITINLLNATTQNVFFDSNVSYVYVTLLWVILWSALTQQPKDKVTSG